MFDITTAATIRPDILEITLKSFRQHLFGQSQDYRLIINIDPIGATEDFNQEDVEYVARQHFDNVLINKPEKANFNKAMMWVWSQVKSEFFFNLEDDWKLLAKLDFSYMLKVMQDYKKLAGLTIAKGHSDTKYAQFSHSHKRPLGVWNGAYYEISWLRYRGMPSLWRKTFIDGFREYMTPDINHECLERKLFKKNAPCIMNWNYGGYTGFNIPHSLIYNTGKGWRKKHAFEKQNIGRNIGWKWSEKK